VLFRSPMDVMEAKSRYIEQEGMPFATRMLNDVPRMARLCAFLRKRKAYDSVGHSIFIYRLGADELDQALYGPPAELHPDRGVKGLVQTTQGNVK